MAEISDPPPWLTALIDQRLALLQEAAGPLLALFPQTLVMLSLNDPPAGATPEQVQQWERQCDHCHHVCHDTDEPFFTAHISQKVGDKQVVITFGVCETCRF